MLDVMSGGRLIAGMVIGGGPEYFSYQVNPTHARERFREALDLIVKAWTTPGPFAWNSKHYFFRYVNPWPRPLQQPHPPIWIPGRRQPGDDRVRGPAALLPTWAFPISTSTSSAGSSPSSARPARRRATRPPRSRWAGACRSTWPRPTSRPARNSSRAAGISSAQPAQGDRPDAARLHLAASRPWRSSRTASSSSPSRRPGTTSKRASSPSSAARTRCGRSWRTTRRSWAPAWC